MKNAKLSADLFRRQQLTAIHAEKARLKMDDETYRAVLLRVSAETGCKIALCSSASMDSVQRAGVLDALREIGERQFSAQWLALPDAPQNVRAELKAMVGKIAAILAEGNLSWAYAYGTAKKMFDADRIEWLHTGQMHKLVAALIFDQRRRRAARRARP